MARIVLSGRGNMDFIEFPFLKEKIPRAADFKFYEPQITEKEGKKIFEQVLLPRIPNVGEIPRMTFSYFDPQAGRYRTVSRGPFPLNVQPLEESDMPAAGLDAGGRPAREEPSALGEDILFIKGRLGALQPSGYRFYRRPWFWGALMSIILLWAVLRILFSIRFRLQTDQRFAQRLRAPRSARRHLNAAKQYLDEDNQDAFFDEIFRALQVYFSNKFHIPAGAVNPEVIKEQLGRNHNGGQVMEQVEDIFRECQAVRYAGTSVEPVRMEYIYRTAREVVDYCERKR